MPKVNKLIVKNESLPYRCDICHQSDCFDAQTNCCLRCQNVQILPPTGAQTSFIRVSPQTVQQVFLGLTKLGFVTGSSTATVLACFWLFSGKTSAGALALAILAIIGGPLCGIFFGVMFGIAALVLNWIEAFKWRLTGRRRPIVPL